MYYKINPTDPTTDEVKYCEKCQKLVENYYNILLNGEYYEIRICKECPMIEELEE